MRGDTGLSTIYEQNISTLVLTFSFGYVAYSLKIQDFQTCHVYIRNQLDQ